MFVLPLLPFAHQGLDCYNKSLDIQSEDYHAERKHGEDSEYCYGED